MEKTTEVYVATGVPAETPVAVVNWPKSWMRAVMVTLVALIVGVALGLGWVAWQMHELRSEVRDALAWRDHAQKMEAIDGDSER